MRRFWGGPEFFSFYEHLGPRQMQDLLTIGMQENIHLEQIVGKGNMVPHLAIFIRKDPQNEETILNHIIGIA